MKLSHIPISVRICTCAEHGIRMSFTSILASLVCGCESDTHCPSCLSQARNEVSWWLLTSFVSWSQEWAFFHVTFDIKRLLFRLCGKSFAAGQQSKMADARGTSDRRAPHHDTGHHHSVTGPVGWWLRREAQLKFLVTLMLEDDGSTRQQQDSVAATSSKTSKATDDRPSRFHVKKSSNTDSASVSVVDRSSRFNGPSGITIVHTVLSVVAEIAIVDLRDVTTQGTSMPKATQADSADRPSRSMTRSRRQFHPASLWWEDPGPTTAQCLLGSRDLNAIDHAVVNGVAEIGVTGMRDVTTRQGSVTRLGIKRVGSGPGPRFRRQGPAPGPSRLIQRMFRGLAMLRGGRRMSGLLLPVIIIMEDVRVWTRRSLDRPTCPDVMYSCLQSYRRHLRRELSQWSHRLPDQQGWTTRQVWRARQTRQSWPTRQVWRRSRLGRWPGLSRWRVSRGSRLSSRWRAPGCGRLGRCCRPGTWRRLGRCGRLSRSKGLGSWRLSKGWRACCPGYPLCEHWWSDPLVPEGPLNCEDRSTSDTLAESVLLDS